ncbi:MAG: MauE/DoxX family redox-associated membrane protein, partial [Terracidiphilus sp.]
MTIGRLALAAVFLVAAYAKLKPQVAMPWSITSIKTSLSMFAMQVDSYQLLPPSQVIRVAHVLPFFELFLGLWLLSGIALRFSSLVTTLALTGFFTLMVRTYALGLSI